MPSAPGLDYETCDLTNSIPAIAPSSKNAQGAEKGIVSESSAIRLRPQSVPEFRPERTKKQDHVRMAGDSPGVPEFTFQAFDLILRDSALTEMG